MPTLPPTVNAPTIQDQRRTPPVGVWSVSWRQAIIVAAAAAVANALTWAALVASLPWRQQAIALRYNIYTGISLLGSPGQLL